INLAANNLNAPPQPNEFLSLLPPCILPRISKLKSLNEARDAILEEYKVERAALERRYKEKMEPLFVERRGVVFAEGEVEDVVSDNEGDEVGDEVVKGIPQFWACAMGHVDVIGELITEEDVDCLDFLTDITSTDSTDGQGFSLTFHFSPNPYFTNTTLTKTYEVPNLLTEDEPILQNVTGTTINWKPGQSLTHKETSKKQRKKSGPQAGQIRTVKKLERTDSFFHFFTPPKMPSLGDIIDEEEADAMEEMFDHDYDIAQAFRGSIIPKAVLWFTGEAMEEDMDGMMDEE
ncbi:predicted protein, partial [Thalassiosira pseudonana CCMP1335]